MSSFAQSGHCEISYSSVEKGFSLRFMGGETEVLEDITLEECLAQAQRSLGATRVWSTLIRKEKRLITQASYKFKGGSVHSKGSLALPGYEL